VLPPRLPNGRTWSGKQAPARLALGPDVYGYISTALRARLEQLEAYKHVTMSTDCDDVQPR